MSCQSLRDSVENYLQFDALTLKIIVEVILAQIAMSQAFDEISARCLTVLKAVQSCRLSMIVYFHYDVNIKVKCA